MSFPCEASVSYPKRNGCLNYHDDPTHKGAPPDFGKLLGMVSGAGFVIEFSARNYKPKMLWLIGLVSEPLSRLSKQVLRGTWEFYGFESIIIARKLAAPPT